MVVDKAIGLIMTDFTQDLSTMTDAQNASLNSLIVENEIAGFIDEFWSEELFKNTGIRKAFEERVTELANGSLEIYRAENLRGIAWLCVRYVGMICTKILAKFELISSFSKYFAEFNFGLSYEDFGSSGHRYFANDEFEMIGSLN